MDTCLVIFFIFLILFVIGFILIVVIGRRPKPLCSIPNRDINTYRQEALNKLTYQNYLIKEKQNGNIFVQKDTFSATTLVFKQNGSNVDVLFIHSNSNLLLAAFIITIITIWIIAIVLAVIADSNSKSFREKELIPILSEYGKGAICTNCHRSIPIDARLCPYCAKKIL